MGLRGDHLVTLFIHSKATPVRPGISGLAFHLTALHRGKLLILLTVTLSCFVPQSLAANSQQGNAAPAPSIPLLHTTFSEPPQEDLWQGNLGYFSPEPGHDPGMLRLDAPSDLGTAYLSTRQSYSAVHWEWYIRQAFAPSNNNRAFVFLNEATGRLDDQPNGLAVRTGENGTPKHFRVFHFDQGTASSEWLKSDMEISADTGYRVRLLLTPDRELHLYVAEGRHGTPLLQSETAKLPESMTMDGHFGFLARYTATRSNQFYFSDVWIADVLPEPGIAAFTVSGASDPSPPVPHPWQNDSDGTVITVTFEIPPESDAKNLDLFRLENGPAPDELHCDHPQVCSLLYRDPLPSGEMQLVVESYRTIYGQQSQPETLDFMVAAKAVADDVVINEFMYRPPAGIPAYVELFNRSDKLLNLRNWRLQRRAVSTEPVRLISGDDLFLPPGSYLVLTADAALLTNMPGAANAHEMAAFPRFNTASSDEIRLFSNDGTLVDSLQYVPSQWGGFEVALERKSPDVPGWIPENWAESASEHGGTPGRINSVRPPDIPPELTGIDHAQPQLLKLTFSHRLDPSSIDGPGAVRLFETGDVRINASQSKTGYPNLSRGQESSREIAATITQAGEMEVFANLAESMQHGMRYILLVSEIRDIFGNRMDPAENEFRYYETASPDVRDVVVNEVLYRPGTNSPRFIEILNRSDKVFDLRGWKVGRSLGSAVLLTDPDASDPAFLIPGELAVVSESGLVLEESDARHFELPGFLLLSRFGDTVYLVSDNGIVTDSLAYEPFWGGNRDGVSLERVDPDGATNDPANWKEHPHTHSAGMANHHFEPSPEPVSLLRALLVDESRITLTFSRHVSLQSLNGVMLGQDPLNPVIANDTPEYGSLYQFQAQAEIERVHETVHIGSVNDFAGRESRNLSAPLVFPPDPGDIIINEVMYQPIADRHSRRADQGEYVEMYNRSALHLKMDKVHMHDRPDKNGGVRRMHPADSDMTTLDPGQHAVFYADTSSFFHDSRLSRAFPEADPQEALFLRMDRLTLGLSTQGGEVYIAVDGRGVLDSLWYHPSWHNPNLPDARGISLERIDSGLPTGDRANWTSSASPHGGTPGRPNSVMMPSGISDEAGLTLSPNPFSPNGNGMDDHLVIHYNLDGPDYMILVRIFDRHGRRVRTLADGLAAGRSGKLIWDGRTDRGIMNRAGMYIVHLEAWNAAQNTRSAYREIAVLAFPL